MTEKAKLDADIANFFAARDKVLVKYQVYWFNKMVSNRRRMGLPDVEFDATYNYIPSSILRDVTGVPIPGQHPDLED